MTKRKQETGHLESGGENRDDIVAEASPGYLLKERGGMPPRAIGTPDTAVTVLGLRKRLGMPRDTFKRLLGISERRLADIEAGHARLSDVFARRHTEIGRMVEALEEVLPGEEVGPWLLRPNPAFGELKPLEVIERGQIDRLWEMIFHLRSGVPG